MNIISNRKFAFTLAELMVILAIISVITIASVKISKSRSDYAIAFQAYATFANLQIAASELISEGYLVWSDSESKPVVSSSDAKSLPGVANDTEHGLGFCNRIYDLMNTIGAFNNCSLTANDATDFVSATPNFVTTNGAKYYNFGADAGTPCPANYTETPSDIKPFGKCYCRGANGHWDAPISTSGCSYDEANYTLKRPSLNDYINTIKNYGYVIPPWTSTPCATGHYVFQNVTNWICGADDSTQQHDYFINPVGKFIIYVDIDGRRGKSELNKDVFKFWIFTDGTVMPADDSLMLDNPKYLSASVKGPTGSLVSKGIGYKKAICLSNKVDLSKVSANFCSSSGYSAVAGCTAGGNNLCTFIINKPGY